MKSKEDLAPDRRPTKRKNLAAHPSPSPIEAAEAPKPLRGGWPRYLLPTLCLVLVGLMSIDWLPAPDLWWQLKTGELIWTTHRIPHRDLFSFTAAGHPWYVQEWLTELCFYGLYRWVSPEALVMYEIAGAVLAFGFVLWRIRLRCGSVWVAAGVTLLAAWVTSPYFDMRPQMVSYVMVSLSLLLVEQWHRGAWSRAIWFLPAIALLWVNLHAGFVLLFALLGVEIAGAAFDFGFRISDSEKGNEGIRGDEGDIALVRQSPHLSSSPHPPYRCGRLATLGLVALLCGLAGLANPNGLSAYTYPFLFLRHRELMEIVGEWLSPNFHIPWIRRLLFLLLLLAFSLAVRRRRCLPDLLLMAGLIHSVLFSARHLPVFAIACAPIVAEGLDDVRGRIQAWMTEWRWSYTRWGTAAAAGMSCALGAGLVAGVRALPRGSWFAYCAVVPAFPVRACDYLMTHPEGGRLFDYYAWGGYCIWRLWPRYRVFLDGRAEVYLNAGRAEDSALQAMKQPREDLLRHWNVETVLLPASDPFAQSLTREPGWRAVYQDEQAVVLRSVPVGLAVAATRDGGATREALR